MTESLRLMSSRDYRNNQIEVSKRMVRYYTEEESKIRPKGDVAWFPINAGIDEGLHSFDSWFRRVLPSGYSSMRTYIEDTLSSKTSRRGLEIGGIGSRFFGGFPTGFFTASAGISLTDLRKDPRYKGAQARILAQDEARNHKVIEGDMLSEKVKQDVLTWSKGEKIDLIIERMYAGINSLPNEPFYLSRQMNFWYDLLAEGGLLFAQVPRAFHPYITQWESYIRQAYRGQLDVQVRRNDNHYVMRLHKLAAEQLPLLDPYEVMEIERENYPRVVARRIKENN